jgi:ferrochelatase
MPNFAGAEDFKHDSETRIGVMLVNLGTPDEPTAPAVRRYLDEFLSDPRVVEFPRLPWWLIMNLFILRFRPRRVAKAYASVWHEGGSPLLVHSQNQAEALQAELDKNFPERFKVALAMRYGNPAIRDVLDDFRKQHCRHLVVIPMFPQYSATTTASIFDEVTRVMQNWRMLPQLRMPLHYHDNPDYIELLATSVEESRKKHGRGELLLMSFHGLPERYLHAGDPYHCECMKTARLLADRLGLEKNEWQAVFQSRFGREPWLQPYLDKTLEKLPASGVRSVDVICPGFSADCLETLEEVAVENRDLFIGAGGERYQYIPALNDHPEHIRLLANVVETEARSWMAEVEMYNEPEQSRQRMQNARDMGAQA